MARNLARSSSGTAWFSASASTRALKSNQDSSRLRKRPSGNASSSGGSPASGGSPSARGGVAPEVVGLTLPSSPERWKREKARGKTMGGQPQVTAGKSRP